MPTKYDVFAEIVEHAPCKANDLNFKTPIYAHLRHLVNVGWIKKSGSSYVPINSKATLPMFKIIKYCLKNGLDHNRFFSKNMFPVVKELSGSIPNLRPQKLKANKENTLILNYLEDNQFIILTKRRPRRGLILPHQIFLYLSELNNEKIVITANYVDVGNDVLRLKVGATNPFADNIFQFLAGSAQLEGSTITAGETRDLILNDIYPEKPKKDIQMVKNLNEAMHYVLEHLEEEITPEHIKEINKNVMFSMHRDAGKYKTVNNKIHDNPLFKTAQPGHVPLLIQNYCNFLKSIKDKGMCMGRAGYIHNEIQHIHPFSDGNSRTTRMIINWMLLKHNLPLLVLRMGCFDEYMGMTKLSARREDNKLTLFFQHLILHESLIN